jgi:hypothetical protein
MVVVLLPGTVWLQEDIGEFELHQLCDERICNFEPFMCIR